MNKEYTTLDLISQMNRRGFEVSLGIFARQTHVPFGVKRIIFLPVGHCPPRYPSGKCIAMGHRVEGQKPAKAPTPNRELLLIDPRLIPQPAHRRHDISELLLSDPQMNFPCVSQPSTRAGAIIDKQGCDPLPGQQLTIQAADTRKTVPHDWRRRPTIDFNHHRTRICLAGRWRANQHRWQRGSICSLNAENLRLNHRSLEL